MGPELAQGGAQLPGGARQTRAVQEHQPRGCPGEVKLSSKNIPLTHFVCQVSLVDGTLYSCGADGSMKMRKLPDRDVFVNCREGY